MAELSRDELIHLMRQVAEKVGDSKVPRHRFLRETGLSERVVAKKFGSYNALVEAAGLRPMKFPTRGERVYADNELLGEVLRVLRLPDAKLTRIFFEQNSSVSSSVCERRFAGWLNTLKSAASRLDAEHDATLISRIEEYASPFVGLAQPSVTTHERAEEESPARPTPYPRADFIPAEGASLYGDFINFRGLQHAPVVEQGVVFLFGMICRELGYVVESVRSSFPDCEAKRQIRGRPDKWQRVRIEFEYQSRSFLAHGHDPHQCDVIVCWEDNWADCPLEVLELRSALARLPKSV